MPSKQREYITRLIEQATEAALNSGTILFDPQGRALIDVPVSEDDKVLFREGFGRDDPSSVVTVSLDVMDNPKLLDAYKAQYLLTDEQCDQLSGVRGSIIPLQQEFNFHLSLAARTYTAADDKQFPADKMALAHQAAMQRLQPLIVAEFTNALAKATKGQFIDDVKLIQEQDKSRKTLSAQAHSILLEEIVRETGVRLTKAELKAMDLKHTAEATTATPNDLLHTDNSLEQITWIAGSEVTAHDRGIGTLADRQIVTFAQDEAKQGSERLQIRTPSLDVKEGVTEQAAVADVKDKLQELSTKYAMEDVIEPNNLGIKAFTYNLHTAINDRLDNLQGKNKQSDGARIILSGAHQYNKAQRGKESPVLCLVQNISVNGFGDSLGYKGNSLLTEATLMAEMSMLHHLSDKGQKENIEEIFEIYGRYLEQPDDTRPSFFSKAQEGKEAITLIEGVKAAWRNDNDSELVSVADKAKGALRTMMANDLHHQHEYAKLTQALSVFIEQASISGCKSGNERAQAINGRVAVLDSVAQDPASPIMQAIEALAKAKPADVASLATDLKQKLDTKYDKHLQSAVSLISAVDQGAAAKVNAKVSWFKSIFAQFNRNYAEESSLEHLKQDKAGNMQAHKGLTKQMISAVEGHPKSYWEYMSSKVGAIGAALSYLVYPITAYLHKQYKKDLQGEVSATLGNIAKEAHVSQVTMHSDSDSNPSFSDVEDDDVDIDMSDEGPLLDKPSADKGAEVPGPAFQKSKSNSVVTTKASTNVIDFGVFKKVVAEGRAQAQEKSSDVDLDSSSGSEPKGP
ncbi:MAG: hypothetical protein P4L65_06245 [Legionella sp.]|nr:hypothetical protein [Legionella sp.]